MIKEELFDDHYDGLDYDEENVGYSATTYFYSRGLSATVDDNPQLSNGKVAPESGDSSTQFYYSVDYSDTNKDVPATISVFVDDIPSTLTLDSAVAYNGTYKSAAKTLGSGNHTYYFNATDGSGGSARLPVSESYSVPTVNNLPRLSSGEVIPPSGGDSTDFYYYVDYYDEEEDVPLTAYVYIDNVAYVMSLYSGKGYNGTYRYGPKLLKSGNHDSYFSFGDGYNDIVKLPSEGSYSEPEILSGAIYVYDNMGDAREF